MSLDDCDKCEQMLQPYLDRELTEQEMREAQQHLDTCTYCRKRYRFEASLRRYVHQVVAEPMTPELKQRLSELRTPL